MLINNIKLFEDNFDVGQRLFNMCHPVGDVYVQYPQQEPPEEHYNKNGITSSWEELNYDGAFFRAAGGDAYAFEYLLEISSISGTNVIFTSDHNFDLNPRSPILFDAEHNESRVVIERINHNSVVINEPFSNENIDFVYVSQEYKGKYHNHTINYWNTDRLNGGLVSGSNGVHNNHYAWGSTYDSGDPLRPILANDGYTTIRSDSTGSDHDHNISVGNFNHDHKISKEGDENCKEARPDNFTIKIWKRIA